MPDQDFEVRPSVQVGETADVGLHRGITVLRNEGINPMVSVEFSPTRSGVLCGIREVKALLQKVLPEGNREALALEEGAQVAAGEVALRITAPYGSFGLYETAISRYPLSLHRMGHCQQGVRNSGRWNTGYIGRSASCPPQCRRHHGLLGLDRRVRVLLDRRGRQAGRRDSHGHHISGRSSDYGRHPEGYAGL